MIVGFHKSLRTYASVCCLMLPLLLTGCFKKSGPPELASINIIDRNGMSETISSKDRLGKYENVDFLENQPYQKVLRIYNRDERGNINAYITSYHPNGQPKQYLEVVNNRAFGAYREWHSNGQLKLETYVIGGDADVNTAAEQSWLFEGCSKVWDDEGHLIAQIPYCNGELQGDSLYYHKNGLLWKKLPYNKDKVEGTFETYLDNGSIFQTMEYVQGVKEGASKKYWDDSNIAADEIYSKGLLTTGRYFDRSGKLIAQVDGGEGLRALFGKTSMSELQEYRNGVQEGAVKLFTENGTLARLYHIKDGIKDGEEVEYYETKAAGRPNVPKLSMTWSEGKIQGIVKTWYPNGTQESQREMANNAKNGLLTAWYSDGSLMLIEQYERNKLCKGEYYAKGEKLPISEISNGRGLATLYDPKGNFLRKVLYANGKPLVE